MITFCISILLLIAGYLIYGAFVEKTFGANPKRPTPCHTMADGIDYTKMPTWRIFMIQFLNIAGTGPIFGAIQGILFGPAAYIWIVIGCIFGGAVHDYISGMISIRKNGASLPEIVGDELGATGRFFMRTLAIVLMVLVGATFTNAPAGLLANMIGGDSMLANNMTWIYIIIAYYFCATLLPINKLIGKIYPLFGISLLIMAVAIFWGLFTHEGNIPEITSAFTNNHPNQSLHLLPALCITISCGAISGFHATQSPMMARCLDNEKYGRPIFYGAMITEGFFALIWAAAAIKFADSFDISTITFSPEFTADLSTPYGKLMAIMTNGGNSAPNPAIVVNAICSSWLNTVGAILVVLGVVAAPITTGDTAFRSARLIMADILHIKQNSIMKRIAICIPIFAVSITLMFVNFDILWRYFFWINQNIALFTLIAISCWLARHHKNDWITFIPALWMAWVCLTHILMAPEGFNINYTASCIIGAVGVLTLLIWYTHKRKSLLKSTLNRKD